MKDNKIPYEGFRTFAEQYKMFADVNKPTRRVFFWPWPDVPRDRDIFMVTEVRDNMVEFVWIGSSAPVENTDRWFHWFRRHWRS